MPHERSVTLSVFQAADVASALAAVIPQLEAYEAHLRRVGTSLELPSLGRDVATAMRALDDARDALLVVRDAIGGYVLAERRGDGPEALFG